jgi:hypothetical protein
MKIDAAAKALLLKEFVAAFALSMRYFFKPKAPLSQWGRALHRLQALRGDLPGASDHHRGGAAPQRRDAAHHAL